MRVGLHWPNPGKWYRNDSPAVELAYLTGVTGAGDLMATMGRVENYAIRYKQASIVLRIDWSVDMAYPSATYGELLKPLKALKCLGNRLILQCGNEPQLGQGGTAKHVVNCYEWFVDSITCILPEAKIGSIPIATFNPDRMGVPNASASVKGREWSPWSDLHIYLLGQCAKIRKPDVLIEHIYGDASLPIRQDALLVDSHGWRFGINIAKTWQENHELLGLNDLPVFVAEFNSASRGIVAPHRPKDNYVRGWLQSAVKYIADAMYGRVTDLCWFVGEGRGVWDAFAPDINGNAHQVWLANDLAELRSHTGASDGI